MELIEDVEIERKLIEKAIKTYGSNAEQNYGYYLAHQAADPAGDQCVYIKAGKYGILTTFDASSKHWIMISTPIAPVRKQASLLKEALDFLREKKKLKKFVAEFEKEKKKKLIRC